MLEAIFNPENAVFCVINKILDLMMLSLVWVLCCIPVVTAGASSAALYHAVVKSVRRQRGYPVREFWKSFRANLRKGILIQVIWMLFAAMMFVSDLPLAAALLNGEGIPDKVLLSLLVLKAVFLVGMPCWLYPLLSRFEERLLKLAEAALYLLIRCLPLTLLSVVLLSGALLLLVWEPLLVAAVPGITALLLSLLLEPSLRKVTRLEEAQGSDAWYLA